MVKNGESRSAVKLFVQALSSLKSEIKCQTKCSSSQCHSSSMDANESPLIKIAVDSKKESSGMATYDCFFGLNPKTNPCTPQHRDGSTACLLYNMAVTEHKLGLGQDTKTRQVYLKKATNIYNMAFSAAQHWKKYTEQHLGCQILSLAILNNLLTIHHELQHADKVSQLHTLLRDTLFSHGKGDEISSEELSLFAKNLQLCTTGSMAPATALPQHTEQVA
jgi:hypothetical protein